MVTRRELLIGGGAVLAASAIALPIIADAAPVKYPPFRVERWDWPVPCMWGSKTYHVWTAEQDDAWIEAFLKTQPITVLPKRTVVHSGNAAATLENTEWMAVVFAELHDGMAVLNCPPRPVDYSRAIAYNPHAHNPV